MVQNGSTTLRKPEPHRFKVSQISLEKFNYSNFRSQKVCTGGKSGIFKANNQVHQVTCVKATSHIRMQVLSEHKATYTKVTKPLQSSRNLGPGKKLHFITE